jgi:large conductance mechanosensitive channel
MLAEFKQFLLRGNVVDLAVAVVVGVAFNAMVTALVEGIITPIVTAVVGKPSFAGLTFTINGSVFRYGLFLNSVLSFLSVAAAVFFFVVKPLNALQARRGAREATTTMSCPECLSEIPIGARRCAHCTTALAQA